MDAIRADVSSGLTSALPRRAEGTSTSGAGFAEAIGKAVSETDGLIKTAESAASELAAGEGDAVDTVIAVSKADLAMRHLVTLRNRALEAYQEIMRLPL